MQKRPVAYQLYSAREDAQKDLDAVLGRLAAMGYDGVEFAGLYGHSAEDVAAMLQKYRLQAVSSHVPVMRIEEDMFGVIAEQRPLGCRYLAVPFLDETMRPGAPGFARVLRMVYRFASLCREAGIQLLYHNHDFEFVPVSGLYGLDFLYGAVPAHLLQTELDVCWIRYAGEDPVAYLRKYAGRCPVVHLKDYVGVRGDTSPYGLLGRAEEKKENVPFAFRPFGHGCQDVQAVVSAALESGVQWFVIEQDQSPDRPALEAAQMSLETLRKLGVK